MQQSAYERLGGALPFSVRGNNGALSLLDTDMQGIRVEVALSFDCSRCGLIRTLVFGTISVRLRRRRGASIVFGNWRCSFVQIRVIGLLHRLMSTAVRCTCAAVFNHLKDPRNVRLLSVLLDIPQQCCCRLSGFSSES